MEKITNENEFPARLKAFHDELIVEKELNRKLKEEKKITEKNSR